MLRSSTLSSSILTLTTLGQCDMSIPTWRTKRGSTTLKTIPFYVRLNIRAITLKPLITPVSSRKTQKLSIKPRSTMLRKRTWSDRSYTRLTFRSTPILTTLTMLSITKTKLWPLQSFPLKSRSTIRIPTKWIDGLVGLSTLNKCGCLTPITTSRLFYTIKTTITTSYKSWLNTSSCTKITTYKRTRLIKLVAEQL